MYVSHGPCSVQESIIAFVLCSLPFAYTGRSLIPCRSRTFAAQGRTPVPPPNEPDDDDASAATAAALPSGARGWPGCACTGVVAIRQGSFAAAPWRRRPREARTSAAPRSSRSSPPWRGARTLLPARPRGVPAPPPQPARLRPLHGDAVRRRLGREPHCRRRGVVTGPLVVVGPKLVAC